MSVENTTPEKKTPIATVDLAYPVQDGADTITKLEIFRRPKVRDLIEAQEQGGSNVAKYEANVFAIITTQPFDVIAELDASDYGKIQGVYATFLAG